MLRCCSTCLSLALLACIVAAAKAPVNQGLATSIAEFTAAANLEPRNASLASTVGLLHQLAGNPEETVRWLSYAVHLNRDGIEANVVFNLANNLKAVGRNAEAVEAYNLAIQKDPTNFVYFVLCAITLDFLGEAENAVRAFSTASRMYGAYAAWPSVCRNPLERVQTWLEIYMASALARAPRRGRQAVSMYRKLGGGRQWYTSGLLWDFSSRYLFQIQPHGVAVHEESEFVARVAAGSIVADRDVAAELTLQEEIRRRQQWDVDCRSTRLLLFELGRPDGRTGKIEHEVTGFGFGATIHMLSVALSYALAHNRTLVTRTRDNWWYTDGDHCPKRSFQCYFHALGACTEKDTGSSPPPLSRETEHERVVLGNTRLDAYLASARFRFFLPPEHLSRGLLWWRSQLADYILRPTAAVAASLAQIKHRLRWPLRGAGRRWLIGIHIRHGDKKTESAIVPAETYVDAALRLAQAQCHPGSPTKSACLAGPPQLFVASDDDVNVFKVQQYAARQGANVFALPDEIRGIASATDNLPKLNDVNMTQYALEAIANLFLLSETDHFVGTFSSNFGRLAYELLTTRCRDRGPVGATMDVFWHAYP